MNIALFQGGRRLGVLAFVALAGFGAAVLLPDATEGLRRVVGLAASPPKAAPAKPDDAADDLVKMSADQIAIADVEVGAAGSGRIGRRLTLPGTLALDPDRVAHVSVKLVATVAELRKKVGDPVAKDEVIAVLESREVADAKSEYLAARLTSELEQENFTREQALFGQRATAEKEFQRVRNAAAQATMHLTIARQKLIALGVDPAEIETLPRQAEELLRRQQVRSPIAGQVVERRVNLGMALGRDNLETELFQIADLSKVWIEMAVGASDIAVIAPGQEITVEGRGNAQKARGKVVFVSPIVDKESRTARVVAEIENPDQRWRPGAFATVVLTVSEEQLGVSVPTSAIQTVNGQKSVFVRTADGFRRQPVRIGRNDDRIIEILAGLNPGESIAVRNSFLLKAELMKLAAGD